MTSERILYRAIEKEMKVSYLDYSMSVIVGRALPDVRYGLKPVHRRILYVLHEMGLRYNKPHRKSARVVGEVMGKFHPHGDAAVYDAMVRMAQPFSLRYCLVDGQGNFGSIDGDSPAAMRYTEVRLSKISEEMLKDLEKDTVEWRDNFDGTLKEPVVLPSVLPNLLVNGSSGIAVGMATNMPPHNLGEVVDAILALLQNPEASVGELMEHIHGPDFPTGGIIHGRKGIVDAYSTGKGIIRVRAKIECEDERLIVTELPYMVSKSALLKKIAKLVRKEIINGISDLRDESDRKGMRIVIQLKRGAIPEIVRNQLYKHTEMETTFGVINIALVDGEPRLLTLKQLLWEYIRHRREIIERRTKYDLKKAKERKHILEGFLKALENIDEVIKTIRKSRDVNEARDALIKKFSFSERQAKEILAMRLQSLTSMEAEALKRENEEKEKEIERLSTILTKPGEIDEIIKRELQELKKKYADERRTKIVDAEGEMEIEDLIPEEEVVIIITNQGYVKRLSLDEYRAQRRGGKGLIGMKMKEDDTISSVFISSTHDYILFFSSIGKVYAIKGYQIPSGDRHARGRAVVNLMPIEGKIKAALPIKDFSKGSLIFATKRGVVKKTLLKAYKNIRANGIRAINLTEGDELLGVKLSYGDEKIILASLRGSACVFDEKEIRHMGRATRGVRGMRLHKGDEVASFEVTNEKDVLTITENGYGKRTLLENYRLTKRGAYGVRTIITNERNGNVIAIMGVSEEDEIIVSSKLGMMVRIPVKEIRRQGRNTMGVRIMNLKKGDKVVSVTKI